MLSFIFFNDSTPAVYVVTSNILHNDDDDAKDFLINRLLVS